MESPSATHPPSDGRSHDSRSLAMKSYGRLTGLLIAGWFVFALSASALHLFRNDSDRIGVAVAIAALTPIVVFSLWLAPSDRFRQLALSFNPRLLTSFQTCRIVGFVFGLLA